MHLIRSFVGCLIVSFASSITCSAGVLENHSSSVLDINGTPATGSFTDESASLKATVDFAVFRANDFMALFPASGYTPSGPLVYTYQVFVDLSSPHSVAEVSLKAFLPDPLLESAPGQFNTPELDGDQPSFARRFSHGIRTYWDFNNQGDRSPLFTIDPGQSSWGLAMSSDFVPMLWNNGFILESFRGRGIIDTAYGPSSVRFIPEPTTTALVLATLCLVMSRRRGWSL